MAVAAFDRVEIAVPSINARPWSASNRKDRIRVRELEGRVGDLQLVRPSRREIAFDEVTGRPSSFIPFGGFDKTTTANAP